MSAERSTCTAALSRWAPIGRARAAPGELIMLEAGGAKIGIDSACIGGGKPWPWLWNYADA